MTRSLQELRQYLAGEWLFENDFQDTSGNENHGIPTDVEWKPTDRGMKPRFDGSSSYVNCGNNNCLNITDEITISAYAKISDFNDYRRLITKNRISAYCLRAMQTSGHKIEFSLYIDGNLKKVSSDTFDNNSWNHIVCTYNGSIMKIYINKIQQTTTLSVNGAIGTNLDNLLIGRRSDLASYLDATIDNVQIYNTALTINEVAFLEEELQKYHGVIPAERSYQHDPSKVLPIQSGEVGRWGGDKESTTVVTDQSGNDNHGTIHGCMPADGFLTGGRRYDGVDDKITTSLLPTENGMMQCMFKTSTLGRFLFGSNDGKRCYIGLNGTYIGTGIGSTSFTIAYDSSVSRCDDKFHHILVTYGTRTKIYTDGVLQYDGIRSGAISQFPMYIGTMNPDPAELKGLLIFASMGAIELNELQSITIFNTLARLPFWSVNYTDYPDNVTEYTDALPYSSSIISSGTFKVDSDKLQCVSAGTITYRAAHEFDSNEYIKVMIGGVEYAGTGTVTHGNTTVSVSQGDNHIAIQMGIGDTIDRCDIQFRDEV